MEYSSKKSGCSRGCANCSGCMSQSNYSSNYSTKNSQLRNYSSESRRYK